MPSLSLVRRSPTRFARTGRASDGRLRRRHPLPEPQFNEGGCFRGISRRLTLERPRSRPCVQAPLATHVRVNGGAPRTSFHGDARNRAIPNRWLSQTLADNQTSRKTSPTGIDKHAFIDGSRNETHAVLDVVSAWVSFLDPPYAAYRSIVHCGRRCLSWLYPTSVIVVEDKSKNLTECRLYSRTSCESSIEVPDR